MKRYYKKGSWNLVCGVCDKEIKAEQMKKRWDGILTCGDYGCWEPRHPQDMIRPPKETSNKLPFTNPEQTGPYIGPDYASAPEVPAIPDGTFNPDTL